jgi:FkbM family methyltransferase
LGCFFNMVEIKLAHLFSGENLLKRVLRDFRSNTSSLSSRKVGTNLAHFLSGIDLKLVDIGARGEALPDLMILAPYSHLFACEPETKAYQLLSGNRKSEFWRELTLIREAIASVSEKSLLHVTRHPGYSSLLLPDPQIFGKYFTDDGFDVVSTEEVLTISLDYASEKYNFVDACFVKIDTQGSELDILRSGENLLQSAVAGIYIEAEFQPFYKGQPLFSDVDAYLRSLGFSLFDLYKSCLRRANHRPDIYSRRQVVWGHALYLKEIPSKHNSILELSRLLALAIAFEHYDFAFDLIKLEPLASFIQNGYGQDLYFDLSALVKARTKSVLKKTRSSKSLLYYGSKEKPERNE